jgi:hypothetical protein
VRRFAPQLFAQLFCFSAICVFVSSAQAQLPVRPNGTQDIQNREWALSNIRREANTNTPLADRERQLFQLSLQEDFRQLQLINNSLMKRMFEPVSAAEKITHKEIRSSLGDIKKLAKRLRVNLGIPETNESSEKAERSVELGPGLLMLDKAVMSFVENPLFQRPRVYDPELAMKASKDVNEIVSLSDFLRTLTKLK